MVNWNTEEGRCVAEIIDIFEDFLEERGIEISTSVEQMKEDNNYEGNSARIYGTDYRDLANEIFEVLNNLRA